MNSEAPAKAAATATVENAIIDWLAESLMASNIYISLTIICMKSVKVSNFDFFL